MNLTTKLAAVLLLSLISQFSFGQYSVQKKKKSYLGLTGGFSYTVPIVKDRYSVLSSIESSDDEILEKEYSKFGKNKGAQFGVRYQYNFTNTMSIVTGIGYQSVSFGYRTQYSWADTVANQQYDREMHHQQRISYFSLPVIARWDLTEGQFKPYLQGGFVFDFRRQANKVIQYDNTIDGEVTENQSSSSAMVSITENTEKFNLGIMGGVGVNFYTKYATFGVESNFRYGFMKVVNDQNRYSDLNGFALKYLDVLDQLKLGVLTIQFSVAVPINNSVTANILRRRRYNRRRR